ncbi:MAG: hypothetical protein ACI39G_03180 [Pseudoramibacter sp.]
MAIKARERVHNKQMSGKVSLAIFLIIIAYITAYWVFIQKHPAIARQFSLVSVIIMIVCLILLLRFDNTMYDLLLTHERLEIERRVTFYHNIVAEIPISHIVGLWRTKNFQEDQLVDGKTFKYTVSPREIPEFKFYTLLYHRDGKTCRVDFQCSDSFYHALRRLITK